MSVDHLHRFEVPEGFDLWEPIFVFCGREFSRVLSVVDRDYRIGWHNRAFHGLGLVLRKGELDGGSVVHAKLRARSPGHLFVASLTATRREGNNISVLVIGVEEQVPGHLGVDIDRLRIVGRLRGVGLGFVIGRGGGAILIAGRVGL